MQRASSEVIQDQIYQLYHLITLTCSTDDQCAVLVSMGILDLLGAHLASYHAHQHFFPLRLSPTQAGTLPPLPQHYTLSALLSAINAIVRHSRHRVARLLYSPMFMTVFCFQRSDIAHDGRGGTSSSGGLVNPLEMRLPRVEYRQQNGFMRAFPALGTASPRVNTAELLENESSSLSLESGVNMSTLQHSRLESSVIPVSYTHLTLPTKRIV